MTISRSSSLNELTFSRSTQHDDKRFTELSALRSNRQATRNSIDEPSTERRQVSQFEQRVANEYTNTRRFRVDEYESTPSLRCVHTGAQSNRFNYSSPDLRLRRESDVSYSPARRNRRSSGSGHKRSSFRQASRTNAQDYFERCRFCRKVFPSVDVHLDVCPFGPYRGGYSDRVIRSDEEDRSRYLF